MNDRNGLREAMKDQNGPHGRHLTAEELIALQQNGELSAPDSDSLRLHLSSCEACLETFKEAGDFFAVETGAVPVDEVAARRVWNNVWREIQPRQSFSRLAMAVAASMAIAAVLSAVWAGSLWQGNRALRQEAEAGRMEQQRLQSQLNSATSSFQSQLAELQAPQLNTPVYDVFSHDSVNRSGVDATLHIPESAKAFVLQLNGSRLPSASDYTIEILNAAGKSVWKGSGLKRDLLGNLSLTLNRATFQPGDYRLRVGTAEYLISID